MYAIVLTLIFKGNNENVGVGGSRTITLGFWTKRAAKGGGWGQSIQPYFELSGMIQYRREKQQLYSTARIPLSRFVVLYESLGGLVLFADVNRILGVGSQDSSHRLQ